MSEHVLEWLPAYHDGELSAARRRQVEAHLPGCPACSAELEALHDLSALLKTDPAPEHASSERFAAQVQLLLPHRTAPVPAAARLPRWVLAAPLLLIVVWAFLQSALWITAAMLSTDWLFPGNALLTNWLGSDGSLDILGTLSVLNLGLLAGVVILWMSWLAFWWAWKHNQDLSIFNRFEKEV